MKVLIDGIVRDSMSIAESCAEHDRRANLNLIEWLTDPAVVAGHGLTVDEAVDVLKDVRRELREEA